MVRALVCTSSSAGMRGVLLTLLRRKPPVATATQLRCLAQEEQHPHHAILALWQPERNLRQRQRHGQTNGRPDSRRDWQEIRQERRPSRARMGYRSWVRVNPNPMRRKSQTPSDSSPSFVADVFFRSRRRRAGSRTICRAISNWRRRMSRRSMGLIRSCGSMIRPHRLGGTFTRIWMGRRSRRVYPEGRCSG